MTRINCLGVVLAGGLSSRMGQDKARLTRNDTDMLGFSKQLLTQVGVDHIVVSGDHYQVRDLFKNAGPVGGIYSVITQYQPEAILALPVDLPLMTSAALLKLKQVGEMSSKACCYQDHHLPLYLPVNGLVELFLQKSFQQFCGKGPAIKALIAQVPHQLLTAEKPETLFNTNTPEQWQQAKLAFSHPRSRYV